MDSDRTVPASGLAVSDQAAGAPQSPRPLWSPPTVTKIGFGLTRSSGHPGPLSDALVYPMSSSKPS